MSKREIYEEVGYADAITADPDHGFSWMAVELHLARATIARLERAGCMVPGCGAQGVFCVAHSDPELVKESRDYWKERAISAERALLGDPELRTLKRGES